MRLRVVWGFLELYQTTFKTIYLQEALRLNDLMIKHFWDRQNGGLFMTADDGETLLIRDKKIYDGAIPSGNSVAALNLLRLGHMTGRQDYLQKAEELTMQEAIALEMYIGTLLTMIENNHMQYQAGFLQSEHWQRNHSELQCMFTVPLFREVATGWPFRASFQAVITEVIGQIPDDADNCWSWGWTYPIE